MGVLAFPTTVDLMVGLPIDGVGAGSRFPAGGAGRTGRRGRRAPTRFAPAMETDLDDGDEDAAGRAGPRCEATWRDARAVQSANGANGSGHS
jgi:hypothetical protein